MPRVGSARRERTVAHNARQVGNYVLSKTLGEGTFGKVKLGVHTLTGEKVAIKVLEKDRIVDKGEGRNHWAGRGDYLSSCHVEQHMR
mgnify:CR=1 FL=1